MNPLIVAGVTALVLTIVAFLTLRAPKPKTIQVYDNLHETDSK
jgi:hypothetical protein